MTQPTIEDVLKKHKSKWSENSYYHRDDILAAMTEWASLQGTACWVKASERLPEDGQIVDIWEMPMTQHLERALSLKGTPYANEYYHDTDYYGWRSTNYKFTVEKDEDGIMNCFTKLEEKYLNPLSSYGYKKLIVENGEVTHWMQRPNKPGDETHCKRVEDLEKEVERLKIGYDNWHEYLKNNL